MADSYKIVYNGQWGLYTIVGDNGQVPSGLEGKWTHKLGAERAMHQWVEEQRGQIKGRKATK